MAARQVQARRWVEILVAGGPVLAFLAMAAARSVALSGVGEKYRVVRVQQYERGPYEERHQ